jgi:hypothetical protein
LQQPRLRGGRMTTKKRFVMFAVALVVLAVVGAWAFLVYTPQGQELQIVLGLAYPPDCK